MKTLCFTLGLLLLTVCCCDAAGDQPDLLGPVKCCVKFSEVKIPQRFISNIIKTHPTCQYKAFIVSIVRGNMFCYRQTFQWALDNYNRLHSTEGSRQ